MVATEQATGGETGRPPVAGVVLAGGGSERFGGGRLKQLLDFAGEPLVRRVAHRVAGAGLVEVVVVVGAGAETVRAAVSGLPVRVVENRDWSRGQGTSVAAGTRALAGTAGAAVFVPCDQPFLGAEVLDTLVAAWQRGGALAVVPTFRGEWRAPALVGRALFPELLALRGDIGARRILARHRQDVEEVPFAEELPFLDLDDSDDYRRLLALAE